MEPRQAKKCLRALHNDKHLSLIINNFNNSHAQLFIEVSGLAFLIEDTVRERIAKGSS